MRRFLFITCLLANLSCSKKINSFNHSESIIEIQKTACFGSCPIYRINFFSNGDVIYDGKKFVKEIGKFKKKIKVKEVEKILNFATKINFSKMKDEYTRPISDIPITYIRIKNKKIKNHIGGPKSL